MENELHSNTSGKPHIAVVGNSVAMRVRPPVDPPGNCNYTMRLREESVGKEDSGGSFHVVNLSSGGTTIREVHKNLNDIIRLYPDYYILNLGVVDASTRDIPRWFFQIINSTNTSWFHRVLRYFHGGVIKRIRRPLVFIRGKRSWVSARAFKRLYDQLIERLLRETNAQVIGLSINLADERVERALPGSLRNHGRFNRIIEKSLYHSRCYFLDLTDLNPEPHYPDGVHFSVEGHRLVADRIKQIIASTHESRN